MSTPLSLLRQLNSRQRPGIWQTHPLASRSEAFRLRYVAVIAFVTAMGRQTTAAEEEGFGNFCAQLSITTEDTQEQLTMRASLDGATLLDILQGIRERSLHVHLLLDILWLHISLGKHSLSEQTALSELCLLLEEPARAWEPLVALVQEVRQSPGSTIEAFKLEGDQRLPEGFFDEFDETEGIGDSDSSVKPSRAGDSGQNPPAGADPYREALARGGFCRSVRPLKSLLP